MTMNRLTDLNNHLFAELERLSDEDLEGEKLLEEVTRAKSITAVSSQIIQNASVILDAMKYQTEFGRSVKLPDLLE